MKEKALTFTILVSLLSIGMTSTVAYLSSTDPVEIEDVKILVLIEEAFGWNYFDIVESLESWGVNVTTVGPLESTPSCYNRDPNPVEPDILTDEIDNETIQEFHGLIIPSGGHWQALAFDTDAQRLIEYAYEFGLYVGGICTGPIPLSRAGQIFNGTRIIGHII